MSSKSSAGNGASLYSPNRSTLMSAESANHHGQTPSTDNSYHPGRPSGLASGFAIAANRDEQRVSEAHILHDVRDVCTFSQQRLLQSSQAIKTMPGVPVKVSDAVVNDMRGIGHQFLTVIQYCNALERMINRNRKAQSDEHFSQRASYEAHQDGTRRQLFKANTTIDELNKKVRELEQALANKLDKNRKSDTEARVNNLKSKIENQKKRINDQTTQIVDLKERLGIPTKAKSTAVIKKTNDSNSPPHEFPHSATSELGNKHRRSPPVPRPRMTSVMNEEDHAFLLNNLKNMNIEGAKGFDPPPAATRMERDNHFKRGPAPVASSLGPFGHQLAGAVGPTEPMYGAPGYYGGCPPSATYGNHNGYPPATAYGNHTGGHPYGGPPVTHDTYGTYGVPNSQPSAPLARPRADPSGYNSALVLRHDDDSEQDPRVDQFRILFARLFGTVEGWTKDNGKSYVLGTAELATRNNPELWEYIKKAATCHKDRVANSNHALFLLRSPDHRAQFMARLLLEYIEGEILRPKFWMGWDKESDTILEKHVIPVLENAGHSFDQRRAARQQLAAVVSRILNDREYPSFREYTAKMHVAALKSIAKPFFLNAVEYPTAIVGLHSIVNVAIETSSKMMTSRLSFSFIWDECGVKFTHNCHYALNENVHGIILQTRQKRIAIVVAPSVSYRDDTPPAMVTRSVCKAEVIVMS